MITKDEEYNKILQQSQVLDKYINKEMKKLALSQFFSAKTDNSYDMIYPTGKENRKNVENCCIFIELMIQFRQGNIVYSKKQRQCKGGNLLSLYVLLKKSIQYMKTQLL